MNDKGQLREHKIPAIDGPFSLTIHENILGYDNISKIFYNFGDMHGFEYKEKVCSVSDSVNVLDLFLGSATKATVKTSFLLENTYGKNEIRDYYCSKAEDGKRDFIGEIICKFWPLYKQKGFSSDVLVNFIDVRQHDQAGIASKTVQDVVVMKKYDHDQIKRIKEWFNKKFNNLLPSGDEVANFLVKFHQSDDLTNEFDSETISLFSFIPPKNISTQPKGQICPRDLCGRIRKQLKDSDEPFRKKFYEFMQKEIAELWDETNVTWLPQLDEDTSVLVYRLWIIDAGMVDFYALARAFRFESKLIFSYLGDNHAKRFRKFLSLFNPDYKTYQTTDRCTVTGGKTPLHIIPANLDNYSFSRKQ